MTVKESILLAAEELGCGGQVRDYLENKGETGKRETEALLRCFNLVENEVALDYLPLYAEDETESETGTILFRPEQKGGPDFGRPERVGEQNSLPALSRIFKNRAGKSKNRLYLHSRGKGVGGQFRFYFTGFSAIARAGNGGRILSCRRAV